jgi:hypothetical protein
MSLLPPCIPAEPEISGIGVRAAIYAQNLLSFIPAISALSDGEVALYELEAVKDQSTTILITAFGILISAMVQARTLGLPNFHASVILNLSWMNNTNTFIYFLLYVQHKSQFGPQQIKSNFISWFKHVKARISGSVTLGDDDSDDLTLKGTLYWNSFNFDHLPGSSDDTESNTALSFKSQTPY